jgi:hypothetical protein
VEVGRSGGVQLLVLLGAIREKDLHASINHLLGVISERKMASCLLGHCEMQDETNQSINLVGVIHERERASWGS